ncbi:hypothetical protein HBH47_072980 [Parastagonospora nodorum]|nr:hypothetical protein HBH47_072980 [Parastagonospora nodorum]
MDRFCTICGFQPKTYAGLAKHTSNETYTSLSNEYNTAQDRKVHVCAADSLSSTVTVYDHIKKDKNADLAIADGISDALDMCAKDDLEVLFQTHDGRLAGELATAESLQRIKCTLGDVDSLFADARLHDLHTRLPFQSGYDIWIQEDIAKTSGLSELEADQHFFVYQNILLLIAFIISHRPFADELVYALSQFFLGNTDYPVHGATVVPIIISVDKTQLLLISGDVAAWPVYVTIGNLSSGFIPTTKIRDPLLKSQVYHYCMGKLLLQNAAKSGILLACADGRIRQCYPTICAILRTEQFTRLQQERCLNKGHDDFVHSVDYFGWKHYNFNIHVSLATDTLHLLLKGLVMKMLDFMQDMLDDIYSGSRKTWDNSTTLVTQESSSTQLNERFQQKAIIQQLIAVVSPLFVSKAPFALHFIRAVCDLVTLAQYKRALERMNVFKEEFRVYRRTLGEEKNFNYPKYICTRANSKAHHITIVKQFYSITNKKEYILQICLHNSRRTALLAADYATVVKQRIQPYLTKLPLSEVAANIAISDFIHAAAVFDRLDVDLSWVGRMSVQIHPSIKCWRSSSKRHNDPEHCDEEVVRCAPNWQQTGLWRRDYVWLYLILTIIDHTRYDKDGKHMAYIRAFSEVLLFNNNGQIDNTTGMLSMRRRAWNAAPKRRTLQAFKFYDLSTIIRPVHLVPRDLPDSTTRTTMSYYVNNYIDWDEYNRLYSPTFDIDLLRTLREYRQKRTRNN